MWLWHLRSPQALTHGNPAGAGPSIFSRARQFRSRDPIIEDELDRVAAMIPAEGLTLKAIARYAGLLTTGRLLTPAEQKRIGQALTNAGFVRQRTMLNGKRRWRWFGPTS